MAVTAVGELGRRVRDMGLVPGTQITVQGRAPLYDPCHAHSHDRDSRVHDHTHEGEHGLHDHPHPDHELEPHGHSH